MDPTIVAAVTGALTALSAEVAKGAASEAGKNAWERIKELLGAKPSEALDAAQTAVIEQIETYPENMVRLLELLKSSHSNNVGRLVGSITAEKVIVANDIGNVNM